MMSAETIRIATASGSRLFGWDVPTWARALKWARTPMHTVDLLDDNTWPALLEVRRDWMLAGGPVSGPTGKVLLDA